MHHLKNSATKSTILILVFSLLWAMNGNAQIGISTKRIYLDQDNTTSNFVISNRNFQAQDCTLSTTHYNFDEFGSMFEHKGQTLPPYAAENIMRYSPKTFKIDANKKQTVRFTLRRKSNIDAIEHRAYLQIACSEIVEESTGIASPDGFVKVTLKPKLVQAIPIIVRPRELPASVEFLNVSLQGETLTFDIAKQGNRSVFAKVQVLQRSNSNIISESAAFPIYLETRQKSFNMAIESGLNLNDLVIKLNEQAEFGGTISHTWPAALNP
jgi:P pilus assembly chaperone PapD